MTKELMTKVDVTDWEGVKKEELALPEKFLVEPKMSVIHTAMLRANKIYSAPYGHVKTRSEVRGGGVKPWRQKGTGRARAGSSRSPLWRGGGITFGPNRNRSFASRLNNKEIKLAKRMLITDLFRTNKVKVVAEIPEIKKTKEFKKALERLATGKTLVISGDGLKFLAARNIPRLTFSTANNLGVPQLMRADTVIIEKKALEELKDRL